MIGMPEDVLRRLAGKAPHLYRCWDEPKKDGSKRRIEAPFPKLKEVQHLLVDRLLGELPVNTSLHGRPGTSQISAARLHVARQTLTTMDLKNFFPSITSRHVQKALGAHGFTADVAELICRLCTRKKRLPQGAPTSPVLARLVISPSLERIRGAVTKASPHARVTQYVDDLAISGPDGIERLAGLAKKIFAQARLSVNPKKTRIMRGSEAKEVLGLKVNKRLEVSDKFAAELTEARRTMAPSDRRLLGKLAWKRRVERSN
jgi:RNA-directed DNA polymerase